VSGNTVYVVSRDNRAWAISTDVGRIRWELPSAPAQALLVGGAAPAVSGGTVVFPFGTGELVAANTETGVRSWATAVAGGRLGVAYSNINDITGDPGHRGRHALRGQPVGPRRGAERGERRTPLDRDGGQLFARSRGR
jgi:outer membrane protein assembly factor BamB